MAAVVSFAVLDRLSLLGVRASIFGFSDADSDLHPGGCQKQLLPVGQIDIFLSTGLKFFCSFRFRFRFPILTTAGVGF